MHSGLPVCTLCLQESVSRASSFNHNPKRRLQVTQLLQEIPLPTQIRMGEHFRQLQNGHTDDAYLGEVFSHAQAVYCRSSRRANWDEHILSIPSTNKERVSQAFARCLASMSMSYACKYIEATGA